jgi:2-polyprenyl-6-methoxyphenol hydroxylase-like FAD-dependent oxidoreductase
MADVDLVVVGGGIGGASLATVMARAGADVLVLERQATYRDQVRGELLWPWGIAEAQALDLETILLEAGANQATTLVSFAEERETEWREPIPGFEGVDRSLNLAHPEACAALTAAAQAAGAQVLTGVRDVTVTPGERPVASFTHDDERHERQPRLVVGADGRTSTVRRQAGIELEFDEPAHLVAGLLVDGLEGVDATVDLVARERDLLFLAFPQTNGRARLYHCFPTNQRDRFAGSEGALRFLAACELDCLPGAERWARARPAGPCATFEACDTRAVTPLAPGIVLIGDAAGYENPLLGQGLSMALRDVREVSSVLLGSTSWTGDLLAPYAATRTRRHHIAKLATIVEVWYADGYEAQDPELRVQRRQRRDEDELLRALEASMWVGYDGFVDVPTEQELSARLGP